MKYIYLIFFSLLLILGWAFGIQNSSVLGYPVVLKLKLGLMGIESIPIALGGLIVMSFMVGILFAVLWLINRELSLRKKLFKANQQNNQLKKEISNLRNQIIDSPDDDDDDDLDSTQQLPSKISSLEN